MKTVTQAIDLDNETLAAAAEQVAAVIDELTSVDDEVFSIQVVPLKLQGVPYISADQGHCNKCGVMVIVIYK